MSRCRLAVILLGSFLSLGAGTVALNRSETAQDARQAVPAQAMVPDTSPPEIEAVEPETTTTTVDPAWQSLVDLAVRIGRCEEPGSGLYGIDWQAAGYNGSQYFEGGLGINAALYRSVAGHSALQDPPEEQIRVFGVLWAQFAQGAWGCRG